MQNGFVESFNGRLRDEWLNKTLFTSLAHAQFVLAAWRQITTQSGHAPIWAARPRRDRRPTCLGAFPQTRCQPIKQPS